MDRFVQRLTVPTFIVAWCCLVGHFAVTALYLAPMSELKAEVYPAVLSYMHPHFRQRWSLFAPDPDGKSKHLQVACRMRQPDGSVLETPYYDLSRSFYDETWKTRLGPNFRVHRAYQAPLSYLSRPKTALVEALAFRAERDPEAKRQLDELLKRTTEQRAEVSRVIVQRIASLRCYRQFPGAQVIEVNPAFDLFDPIPFHQRKGPVAQPPATRVDYGWLPAVDVLDLAALLPRSSERQGRG